ncbi:hypothetical protein C2E31_14045 [Rhodopirellula baltica]|nr:hypothetical protein C2E31_14045 [Rhodopirellula baltica]
MWKTSTKACRAGRKPRGGRSPDQPSQQSRPDFLSGNNLICKSKRTNVARVWVFFNDLANPRELADRIDASCHECQSAIMQAMAYNAAQVLFDEHSRLSPKSL